MSFLKANSGQSLVEILVAVGVAGIIIGAAVYTISFILSSGSSNQQRQIATSLANGLMDKARAVADADWLDIYNVSTKGISSNYYAVASGTKLIVVEGKEGVPSDEIVKGLVGHWKFDEASGTTAFDSSGNSNQGVLTNGPTRATSTCKVSYCLGFDGSNDHVNSGSSSSLSFTNPITISAWVYPTATKSQNSIVTKGDGDFTYNYYFLLQGQNKLRFNQTGGINVVSTNAIPGNNQWTHVVVTYDGSNAVFYINGQFDSTGSGAVGSTNPYPLYIGWDGYDGVPGQNNFIGYIDDVRIYNRALSTDEIKRLYDSQIFTRYFAVENVSRDAADDIVTSGGNNDPSTQKITATVEWSAGGGTPKFQIFDYVTRWRNRVLDQSDWSGGSGQEGPLTEPNNKFASSTNNVDATSTPGSIKLRL